jgi:hypothetical protein
MKKLFRFAIMALAVCTAAVACQNSKDPEKKEEAKEVIKIDGFFSDWVKITTAVESEEGPYYTFKATYDSEFMYFYSKRNFREDYWGNYGYFYYGIDLDNDDTTAMEDPQGMPGVETWICFYPFGGTNEAPALNTTPYGGGLDGWSNYQFAEGALNGSFDDDYVEIEVRVPRADLRINAGTTVKIYSWGNKSASNIKTEALELTIEK